MVGLEYRGSRRYKEYSPDVVGEVFLPAEGLGAIGARVWGLSGVNPLPQNNSNNNKNKPQTLYSFSRNIQKKNGGGASFIWQHQDGS